MERERSRLKAVRPQRRPAPTSDGTAAEAAPRSSGRGGNALEAIARSASGPAPTRVPPAVVRALATEQGEPLPQPALWRQRIGVDVSRARLITSIAAAEAAAAIHARAFTVGHRVFFARGNDASTDGGKLLGHELEHVAQQRDASPPASWDQLPFVPEADAREQAARDGEPILHTPMAIARWADTSPVDAVDYVNSLAINSALAQVFGNIQDDPYDIHQSDAIGRGPFGKYLAANPAFLDELKNTWLFFTWDWKMLSPLLEPDSLVDIVNRSRALDWEQPDPDKDPVPTGKGPRHASESETAIEIANVFVRHYFDSMGRMFPRIAAALVQKNPVPEVDQYIPYRSLTADEVLVSHPMDVQVRDRLLAVQSSLYEQFRAAVSNGDVPYGSLEPPQNSATTTVGFLPRARLWHWVKASPETSTREQAATILFGKPEEAYRLISMKPLWGFRARDVEAFTGESLVGLFQAWSSMKDDPDTELRAPPDITSAVLGLWILFDPAIDPVAELTGAYGDRDAEARFNETSPAAPADPQQAPVVHDEQNVFDDEKAMLGNLDDIEKLLPLFDLEATAVAAARARFTQRLEDVLDQCLPDVESMYRFAEKQRELLVRVSVGIGDAATRLTQSGGGVAPPSVRATLKEMAAAYLAGLSAIELPESAGPRLDAADILARDMDISLEEASLHERLGELSAEYTESFSSDIKDPAVDPFTHSQKLDKQLENLADARIAMRVDPVGTQKKVLELKPKVDSLGFEIGLSEKLARLNMLWSLIDGEEDIWEDALLTDIGRDFKKKNRELYNRFYLQVYLPYTIATAANNDAGRLAAQSAYSDLLKGPEMKAHADAVRDFLAVVARSKKWKKLIVSLVIAFVAFGLGQWEYGAVLAGEGATVFEAAVSAGLVTTATSVVLNKVILDQNPTVIGVLTSFVANAGTFFVIGKIALAAKAAGTEAALAEPAAKAIADVGADVGAAKTAASGAKLTQLAASGGKLVWSLTYQSVIAGAVGMATAEIEKLVESHRTLTWGEVGDVWVQAVISTVAMHVFSAVTPKDLFQYKSPEQKLANELAGLAKDRSALLERAQAIQDAADVTKTPEGQPIPKPDKAGVMDLLDRWKAYLEREQAVRERLLEYAEKNPGKFTEAELAALKNIQPDPTIARQIREAKATLAVEVDGINRYSCAPGALDTVIAQHQAVGNEIARIETDPQTGQRTITVKPADGSPEFVVTEKVAPKGQRTAAKIPVSTARGFEAWLDARDVPNSSVEGQTEMRALYARDPAAAINLASEKYGYQPESVADSELVVHPDAPGSQAPSEPFVSSGEHQMAVTLGHGVVAVGSGRFLAAASELAGMRKSWAKDSKYRATEVRYDVETNTSHFEMEIDGQRVRVEAELAPRVETFGDAVRGTNQVVGGRVSQVMGEEILRGLANGQHEMLKATGISGEPVKPGEKLEFGLGKVDGGYVIVVGEPNAVDWSALPGIEPVGHTHPLHPGNDLQPNYLGNREMTIPELLEPKPDSLINRDLIFPSAQDFVVMAIRRIVGHKVYTGFVIENGVVRKPVAGENLPGLELTIGDTTLAGTNAKGQRVFESTIEGKAGNDTPISKRPIWIVEDSIGGSGGLFMTEPEGITPVAADAELAGGSKTKGAIGPGWRKLGKLYGEDVVHWAMDAGSEAEAAALARLDPPLRDQLMEINAADARDLVQDLTQARIQRALRGGKGGPIAAADLVELRARFGKNGLNSRLDEAGTDPSALKTLAERAELARLALPDPQLVTSFPASEFPADDVGWQDWPPPPPKDAKPAWNEPEGARYRYDRYRYDKWVENGKPDKPPKGLIEDPAEYYDRYVAPKARGQSPGELGSKEHEALVLGVRKQNEIGTQTMGRQRPDAVGGIDQTLSIPNGPTIAPPKGQRVLYEADNFFKNGTQIVSEGREQVRQFRADNPNATIVVQDVANPSNIIVYEKGFQPPPPGILQPGTPNKVPVVNP